MDDRRNAFAPGRPHVTSDGHESAGVSVDRIDVENLARPLHRDDRSKRHEFGAIEALIKKVVRLSPARIGED